MLPLNSEFTVIDHLPKIYHLGPPLSKGKLPSVFYFSLSGEESITLHPYNQPAVYLAEQGFRVFSLTLPGHESLYPHHGAMKSWEEHSIQNFSQDCIQALQFLVGQELVDSQKVGIAGLSRGAFMAAYIAANEEKFKWLLGFAPLTKLAALQEVKETDAFYPSLFQTIEKLIHKSVRFYIGNRDTRVGTVECFNFIHALTEAAYLQNHRSPPVELIIFPSIGHKGHGTPVEIFKDGADWLIESMK